MLGGITSKSLTNVNVALTASEVQNGMLRLTGTLTGNVVISPDAGVTMIGFYYWENLTSGSFSVTFTNSAGSVVLTQSRRGVMWVDTTNGPRIMSMVGSTGPDLIPTGHAIPFYNASVPTGWTVIVANDYAVRIVNNATSGGTGGGSVAFSTLFGRTATDAHTLTINEIPAHFHSDASILLTASVGGGANIAGTASATTTTGVTGGGASHTHGIDMRVAYLNMIVGTRST